MPEAGYVDLTPLQDTLVRCRCGVMVVQRLWDGKRHAWKEVDPPQTPVFGDDHVCVQTQAWADAPEAKGQDASTGLHAQQAGNTV